MDLLQIGPSRIKGAGGGAFARKRINKGDRIIDYTAPVVDPVRALNYGYHRGYLMWQGRKLVDARDPAGRLVLSNGTLLNVHIMNDSDWRKLKFPGVAWKGDSNLARFVNDAKGQDPASRNAINRHGAYYATRNIERGEEILVSYGAQFWRSSNANVCFECGGYGRLIECDGQNCHRSYHFHCTKIKCAPKGKWFCKHCKKR